MKKILLLLLSCTCLSLVLQAQKCFVFIGSYNGDKNKDGIYVYSFNTSSGELQLESTTNNVFNPSFITLSANGNFLYACTDTKTADAGTVSSFRFDPLTKALTFINSQPSQGDNPVYVSVHPNGKWLITANYSGGSAAAFTLLEDGSIGPAMQRIAYTDSSVNKQRQEHSHVHSAVFSPDGNYAFFPDLGADKIRIYKIDTLQLQSMQPSSAAFIGTEPGSGPRHIIFNASGNIAYCTEEMGGMVSAYHFKAGKLKRFQRLATHPEDLTGDFQTADIHLSPDERFLYASNRATKNTIATYSVKQNGKLKLIGYDSTYGIHPRNFAIDPSGKFLIVANQKSGNLVVFKREIITGRLQKVSEVKNIESPSCVKVRQY